MRKRRKGEINLAITFLTMAVTLGGCGDPKPPAATAGTSCVDAQLHYTDEEMQLMEDYQQKQAGVKLTVYENNTFATEVLSVTAPDIGALQDLPPALYGGNGCVRYEGFICFAESGGQQLRISGAAAQITIVYGELRKEAYHDGMHFTAGTYYGITVEFPLRNISSDTAVLFSAASAYKLSQTQPVFGGEQPPAEPIADVHLRDAYILNGPDAYYMTGTYCPSDWRNTNEIHVYRSEDLTEWTDLGAVWNLERDGTWQQGVLSSGDRPVWAPEISYINGTYYIIYSLGWGSMTSSVLRSTSGRAEGPYEDVSDRPMFDYIDGSLFQDEDGSVYAVYSDGRIARMNDSLTAAAETPKLLASESGCSIGFEGCSIFQYEGLYYLTSAVYNTHIREDGSTYVTYDSMYAVSENLYGPYGERRLLLQYGGHNNLFITDDGKVYTTFFYSERFSERPAIAELALSDNGLITTAWQKQETAHIEEHVFAAVPESGLRYGLLLRCRSAVTVLINGKEAFTAQASGGSYYHYEIDSALLCTDGGENRISYSAERNMNIDAYLETWRYIK